ncbi:carbon-nitrogen hydrolase family protein [Sandaracinus amylolyticus]|uniref:carbon-nitrogen hydrolase family protein n=1 Tax=Sandaracinus amylolyticus TaxID=927083 RepID=UPI0014704F15|nr:carbon-nitrogen hydrolase family protein [Sandaracinus amylolyticus]
MTVRVAAVQVRGDRAPLEQRISWIDALLAEAQRGGAKLAVMPELALTGYELGEWNFEVAEPVPDGPSVHALHELARARDMILVAGLSEREGAHVYNTMAVVGPDGFLGRYRKLHPASAECAYWRAGESAHVIETDLGRLGVGICADMIRRTPWSIYAREGVDLVAIGAAWPDYRDATNYPLWREYRAMHVEATRAMPERIERAVGAPVVLANACGTSEVMATRFGPKVVTKLAGRSRVVCGGTIAEDPGDHREQVVIADVQRGARGVNRTPAAAAPEEPWVNHGSNAFRATFQWVDVVTGYLYRPLYHTTPTRQRAYVRPPAR